MNVEKGALGLLQQIDLMSSAALDTGPKQLTPSRDDMEQTLEAILSETELFFKRIHEHKMEDEQNQHDEWELQRSVSRHYDC